MLLAATERHSPGYLYTLVNHDTLPTHLHNLFLLVHFAFRQRHILLCFEIKLCSVGITPANPLHCSARSFYIDDIAYIHSLQANCASSGSAHKRRRYAWFIRAAESTAIL